MRRAKKWWKVGVCWLLLLVMMNGCSGKETIAPCEYEKEKTSTQGAFLSRKELAEYVNTNSVRVKNQTWESKTYRYTLKECFYDTTLGFCVSTVEIEGKNGEALTKTEKSNLKKKIQASDIVELIDGYDASPVEYDIVEKENSLLFRNAFTFATIGSGDTCKEQKTSTDEWKMCMEESGPYTYEKGMFAMPLETCEKKEELVLKNEKSTDVLSVRVTPYGCRVLWNTTQAEKTLEKEMKQLSAERDEESVDLEVWKSMELVKKDGTKQNLCDEKFIYTSEEAQRTEGQHLEVYQVLFKEKTELNQIEAIQIDGVRFQR